MSVNECNQIVLIIPFSVPPIRSNCADPVQFCVSSAWERSISLLIELPLKGLNSGLPVLSQEAGFLGRLKGDVVE